MSVLCYVIMLSGIILAEVKYLFYFYQFDVTFFTAMNAQLHMLHNDITRILRIIRIYMHFVRN
jgi:hypothetical protein